MPVRFGSWGPSHPLLGGLASRAALPFLERAAAAGGFFRAESRFARGHLSDLHERIARGETVHILGIGPGGHDSGVALVRASRDAGLELIRSNEEERFSGKKHCADYPALSLAALLDELPSLGLARSDLHSVAASWDYVALQASAIRCVLDELPGSLAFLRPSAQDPALTARDVLRATFATSSRLAKDLPGAKLIGLPHHDNHAAFSYAVSPFARDEEPVMVAVLDAAGEEGAISLYEGRGGRLRRVLASRDPFDSLGAPYSIISSTQGGWTVLSSEGRYMGAAAWGNGDRLTNPYYLRLRQLFHFGADGAVHLNRSLANWQRGSVLAPYTSELVEILGPPIPRDRLWNPDAILSVDTIEHSPITRDRVDKAAALQMVFEDALFHVIGAFIRRTGSRRLVLTGGCALNCVANMRLLEHFDEDFYQRYTGRKDRLHLWVPPVPGDSGVTAGAAFQLAMSAGAKPGAPLRHAFRCGTPATSAQIQAALRAVPEIGSLPAPCEGFEPLADLLAYLVANDAVIGLFQGRAEIGPRALGHRSIVANPCNPRTLENLNALVKHRERVRPLAPMATRAAAARFFELSPGAGDDDFDAYNYMVLTARARPEARLTIPAVVHQDGTGRVQIVRAELDPFTHAFLLAMGRRVGAEVSVNTSLNVGSPIVQTPAQALEALKRSRGMDGLLFIGEGGEACFAWHQVERAPKDGGRRLRRWIEGWRSAVDAGPDSGR